MTENLLIKLEEKTMLLLSEVEELRKQVHFLNQENHALKMKEEVSIKKLQDLIGLLDAVNSAESPSMALAANVPMSKPVLVQG